MFARILIVVCGLACGAGCVRRTVLRCATRPEMRLVPFESDRRRHSQRVRQHLGTDRVAEPLRRRRRGPLERRGVALSRRRHEFASERHILRHTERSAQNEFDLEEARLYVELTAIPDRLSIYFDQRIAPGGSNNLEAYGRYWSANHTWYVKAGQMYLPYGLRTRRRLGIHS